MRCPLIKKELSISICPVTHCMWRHSESGDCCYTEQDLTVEEYCSRCAKERIEDDQIELLKQKVMERINEDSNSK